MRLRRPTYVVMVGVSEFADEARAEEAWSGWSTPGDTTMIFAEATLAEHQRTFPTPTTLPEAIGVEASPARRVGISIPSVTVAWRHRSLLLMVQAQVIDLDGRAGVADIDRRIGQDDLIELAETMERNASSVAV